MCAEESADLSAFIAAHTLTYTIRELLEATDVPPEGAFRGSDVRHVVESVIAAEGNPCDAIEAADGRLGVLLDRTFLLCRYGQLLIPTPTAKTPRKQPPFLLIPDAVDDRYVYTLGGDALRWLTISRELGFALGHQISLDMDPQGPDGLHKWEDLRRWVDRHHEVFTFLPDKFKWVALVKIAPEDRREASMDEIAARPRKKRARVARS